MTDTPQSIIIKQMRRQILRNLDRVYPSGLTILFLYQTVCAVDEFDDTELLRKDIAYLKEKGYLGFIDEAIGGADSFNEKVVKLTAEGKEIAERTQTDPALEI